MRRELTPIHGHGRRLTTGDRERGSGTVLAVGLVGVVSTLLLAGLLIAAVAVAGQRARTAADLAALAAAGRSLGGADAASSCGVAAQVAERNGAHLSSCDLAGGHAAAPAREAVQVVQVMVTREVAGTGWTVTARARAGGVPP